ncbi:pantoate--beta-alanine ligase, partial [Lachnospira sp.]|uniref:pantoate--beta-alanine ligase n=1 Tax=Lachnospira sp. TaxID=2049031 RepID=UPI00257FD473
LNPEERKAALILNKALTSGKNLLLSGELDADKIKKAITDIINSEPLAKIDYVEIVDTKELQPVKQITGEVLCAIAVYIGKTRLIDNFFA